MALIFMYKPLKDGDTFTFNQIKATKNANGIIFRENLCRVGAFEFQLPLDDVFCDYLVEGNLILIDGKYFGIIRSIEQTQQLNANIVVVSGDDLKGYLTQRITLYPSQNPIQGLQGYDAINNVSTETLVKYYINNNIVNPSNNNRKIYGFTIAEDKKRGLKDDQYMSRFEQLDEVMIKNLEPQKLGYTVMADLKKNQFIFDVIEGVDRTSEQYINNRVIFDVKYKNLISLDYSSSSKNYKNAFYATLSNGRNQAEAMTCLYWRDREEESCGVDRTEKHINVSINLPPEQIYENMRSYALKDAADYEKTENLTVVTTDKYLYGRDYLLGDTVTLQARQGLFRHKKTKLDAQITAVIHHWLRSGGITHELEFGKSKMTRFDVLNRKIKNGGF